jgi:DNA repair exonuclease SbcCD nuclease subunit
MSARIAHISDTHLGSRPRDGVRPNVWGQEMRTQLLENDFYERFAEIFEKIAALDPPVDLVIHSGDLYNSPWEGNPSQPPVVAQEIAISVLQDFIKKTGIPVLVIEGNHGLYRLLEVSLLNGLKLAVPGLDIATQQDLKEAIRNDTPLIRSYEKLDVFCFPFIDHAVLRSSDMLTRYDDWISSQQKRERLRPAVGVAHGMDLDKTLPGAIFTMGYDYIALGHDHKQGKQGPKAWYAGCPERWRFDENKHEKGFLVVDIKVGEEPIVTQHLLEFARPVFNEKFSIKEDDTAESIIERLQTWFSKKGLVTSWDSRTAGRVRMVFEGGSSRVGAFDLGVALDTFRLNILSQDSEYNVVQYIWSTRQSVDSEYVSAAYPEIESEYLIDEPEKDFRDYLRTVEVDKTLDLDLLTNVAVTSLEFAVGKRDGKMTHDTLREDES